VAGDAKAKSPEGVAVNFKDSWGDPPWEIDFAPEARVLPTEVEFAVIGGGFSGLSAAAWLCRFAPGKSTALFEASSLGAGASGHTGGMALAETAAGDLPDLGDVLGGLSQILRELQIDCDLSLPGARELARESGEANAPIDWEDAGRLRVAREIPGGTVDPGKLVSGLARAAGRGGAQIFQNARVEKISFGDKLAIEVAGKRIVAGKILLATNALSLDLSKLEGRAQPKFTLAVATEPLSDAQLETLGLASRKPFYTTDLPYLWGRVFHGSQVIFGSGLVHVGNWRELYDVNVAEGPASELLHQLEGRVRRLHQALGQVGFTNRWGGPILIANDYRPVFERHREGARVLVLGAYSGHGVALSVYLGRWAAEVMLERKSIPAWSGARP
jgi:glycine/D-amino acid oxidase-like deaminating enzyme